MAPELRTEILAYYDRGRERSRLSDASGRLELERVQSILRRELPPAPARLLDVGGGPGVHAAWLARDGYDVVLIDPVPLHVAQALALSAGQPERPFAAEIGDARQLPARDASQDAVVMFGPLYHLLERADRIAALREAARVLRPGGLVAAMAISRFASLLDGTMHGWLATEPEFKAIVLDDLATGRHRSSREPDARWFTTAYFHRPDELAGELAEAGFVDIDLVAVQGPFWLIGDLDARMADPAQQAALLEAVAAIAREPSMLGATGHIIGLARRPEPT
jgi:ubiquinone/menaquinone biosynthesis C-methylase UbiE